MAEQGVENRERIAGPDILRCVAMMMVVVLHFLGKGELLGDVKSADMSAVGMVAWVLEAFCIVAVNVYMLLSGFFLCTSSFKLSRLIQLYLQVWFYSVAVGMSAAALGVIPAAEVDTHFYLSLLFPVSMGHYWFMTAYLFLYLLLPLLTVAVNHMTKEKLKVVLILLLGVFCVLKSILPVRLEGDRQGYDCIWYVCVFLTAAYIRKYGSRFLESRRRCVCLYVGGCLALLAELLILRQIYLCTGSLELILRVSFEYNHVFPLLAAVGLLGAFLGLGTGQAAPVAEKSAVEKLRNAAGNGIGILAGKASAYVLGVYLLHENLGLRYAWQRWFRADDIQTIPQLLACTLAAVVCVFIAGIAVDWIRTGAMRGLHSLLMRLKCYRRLTAGVEKIDGYFKK